MVHVVRQSPSWKPNRHWRHLLYSNWSVTVLKTTGHCEPSSASKNWGPAYSSSTNRRMARETTNPPVRRIFVYRPPQLPDQGTSHGDRVETQCTWWRLHITAVHDACGRFPRLPASDTIGNYCDRLATTTDTASLGLHPQPDRVTVEWGVFDRISPFRKSEDN